ncbi:hypothetical protein EDD11_002873 [Mortierella claussenii]|nr:hypothetical protein EDD11_002873 [Mortierella claussenii]
MTQAAPAPASSSAFSSSNSTKNNTPTSSGTTTPPPSQSESQIRLNIERNHRTLPSGTLSPLQQQQPSKYPSIPRFTPAIPSRMSGNYTPPPPHSPGGNSNSGSYSGSRLGTSSASSSPPGTPPSGLRNYYLNAAFQRSQHHLYSLGSGGTSSPPSSSSTPGSSTTSFQQQHRPTISILIPPQHQHPHHGSRIQTSEAAVLARRSHSADHLQVPGQNGQDELEITVTTPGGTNMNSNPISSATESHVMTLQRALSNLIKNEGLKEEDEEEADEEEEEGRQDGPITMRNFKKASMSTSSSSTTTPPGTPPHKKGVTKFPKVVIERLDPEKAAAAAAAAGGPAGTAAGSGTSTLTHGAGGSDITLAPSTIELLGKEVLFTLIKDKKKNHAGNNNRISRLFNKEPTMAVGSDQQYSNAPTTMTDLTRQPSKAGVLSNLLKLQSNGRQHKQRPVSRPNKAPKEKKARHPMLYSRSANNSTASIHKSVFTTYPPLPATPSVQHHQQPNPGVSTSLSNFQPMPRSANTNSHGSGSSNSRPHSMHFDSYFAQSLASAIHSPMQSPNASPRASFSGAENMPGLGAVLFGGSNGNNNDSAGGYGGTGVHGTHNGAGTPSLSYEEKMRITIAVADILERQDYILRLAKSMIKYGAPSHRLEDAIDHSARHLELNLQCVYLPNVMIVAFTDYETHTSETHLLKVSAGLDMYKCALVHQVHKMVTHSFMPIEEAIMKLEAIHAEKDANSRLVTVLAYAVASFCTAPMFFKGSWIDAGVSFLIGGAVGLLVWLSEKVPSYAHICEITMSVVVAFVTEALHHHRICQSAIKMAGIVIILPGYTITCAILELSSRHIISGSVRLFYAIVFSLLLGYGLTIGASIWTLFDPSSRGEKLSTECPSAPLDPRWKFLFVPLFAISLNIWLKAHPRQWLLATILSIVGYAVSYTSSIYAGAQTEVSSALAAFAIGLLGNVYQRLTRQLSFQAVVCAVFFLVPGSMGLKGALSLFTDDMTGGVNFALQMVVTAIAISVGLFASALVVYPMGKTRSAQMTF